MSKSLGNVLDPFAVIERFGADALRYYLLREVAFGQDGSVSTAAFEARYESELANELGNLASRTIAMVQRYRDGVVRAGGSTRCSAATSRAWPSRSRAARPRRADPALEVIWQRVRRLNRYVEERAPWKLAKDADAGGELDRVLRTLVEGLRVGRRAAVAYLPDSAERAARRRSRPPSGRSLAGARWARGHVRRVHGSSGRCSPRTCSPPRPERRRRRRSDDRLPHPSRPLRAARTPSSWRRPSRRA